MRSLWTVSLFSCLLLCAPLHCSRAQEQQPPPPSVSSAPQYSADSSGSSTKHRSKHADDYLIKGTVFTPVGLSFPGAEVRIRRTTEKKFRWDTYTDSRGEFAVRVKQGSKYEVVARAKGFKDETKEVDATFGNLTDDMVFRMEPKEGKKK